MEKIKEIDHYFKTDEKNNTLIFIGESLKVLIPKYYEDRDFLTIENKIKSLGIFRMQFDNKFESVLLMITTLTLTPSKSITTLIENNEEYYVLEFSNGEVFLDNTSVIKNPDILYKLFMTCIALGKIPDFIPINDLSKLFDNDVLLCGSNLGVNHTIYEMIFSHMSRDLQDPFIFYRNTDMTKPSMIIPLHSIAFGPQSATAKIIGSYFGEAVTSSMIAPHREGAQYELENLLRA